MAFLIGMDAVSTQISGVILLLQKTGSNVDNGNVIRDSQLEDLDVISLMPVSNVLLVPIHPFHDILAGQTV